MEVNSEMKGLKGELAQLARASALHAEGQRFESVILHKKEYIDIRENKRNLIYIIIYVLDGQRVETN